MKHFVYRTSIVFLFSTHSGEKYFQLCKWVNLLIIWKKKFSYFLDTKLSKHWQSQNQRDLWRFVFFFLNDFFRKVLIMLLFFENHNFMSSRNLFVETRTQVVTPSCYDIWTIILVQADLQQKKIKLLRYVHFMNPFGKGVLFTWTNENRQCQTNYFKFRCTRYCTYV